jgi:hypothetical protein
MPLVYENKKARLLYFLKMGINPFKKFVSTGEIKEEIGLVPSRQDFINSVKEIIKNNENMILPIIGEIGIGKTHFYWALKNKLFYHNLVYISLDRIYRKFFYNIYSEFIEVLGIEALRSISNKLCNDWGALEKKFGFFHVADMEKVRKAAFERESQHFKDRVSLMDVINVITAHQLDPYKRIEAENWLLGELMNIKDLSSLNLMHDLRGKQNAFTMLKILIENAKLGTVFFIDDFEKIISMIKTTEEASEVIYDPSYYYDDTESPESIAAKKVLKKILRFQNIKGLKLIITIKSLDALEEIKEIIKEKEPNLLTIFKSPIFMNIFLENDVPNFYKDYLHFFLKGIHYTEFIDDFSESFFPLNKKVLNYIFNKSNGNPREMIKLFIKIFNEIIYSDENLDDILKPYEFSF